MVIVSLFSLPCKDPLKANELLEPYLKPVSVLEGISSLDSSPVVLNILMDQNEVSEQVTQAS